jgi:SH3 domain protein
MWMMNKFTGPLCIILFGLTMVLTVEVTAAEIRFVRPSVEVPVRKGQGTAYKIVKLVRDGDRVELLKEEDAWARVRIGEKAEGWMPKRFLSTEPPPVKLVQLLRTDNEQLKKKNAELSGELTGLKEAQANTGAELSSCIALRNTIQHQYQSLEADTANVVAIKNKMVAAEKELIEVRAALTAIEQQNSDLKRKTALTWFLAGGGVLLLGWIIGVFTGKSRRRRPSLL